MNNFKLNFGILNTFESDIVKNYKKSFLLILFFLFFSFQYSFAQGLLADNNGDGNVVIVAFGDSITRGIGDGIEPGEVVEDAFVRALVSGEAGYPLRIEDETNVNILNRGTNGALVTSTILNDFADFVSRVRPDLVIVSGGSNDSFSASIGPVVGYSFQAMVNIAKALNVEILLVTPPPTCCDRGSNSLFLSSYAGFMRDIADLNEVRIADVNQAFLDFCPDLLDPPTSTCPLLNRNEGLHPNSLGYDLMADVILGSL